MIESRIFVIGFIGSDRRGLARKLAEDKGLTFIDLDKEIEARDGRSIQRICMIMGEHEYRNKEYALLSELSERENIVIACGDGIILDDMNVKILKENVVVVADREFKPEQLWESACKETVPAPYAFMLWKDEAAKKEKFNSLYETRKALYDQF